MLMLDTFMSDFLRHRDRRDPDINPHQAIEELFTYLAFNAGSMALINPTEAGDKSANRWARIYLQVRAQQHKDEKAAQQRLKLQHEYELAQAEFQLKLSQSDKPIQFPRWYKDLQNASRTQPQTEGTRDHVNRLETQPATPEGPSQKPQPIEPVKLTQDTVVAFANSKQSSVPNDAPDTHSTGEDNPSSPQTPKTFGGGFLIQELQPVASVKLTPLDKDSKLTDPKPILIQNGAHTTNPNPPSGVSDAMRELSRGVPSRPPAPPTSQTVKSNRRV